MNIETRTKFRELNEYIPFLERLIEHLSVTPLVGEKRISQLTKITNLHTILTKENTKLQLTALLRCECILNKLTKQFKTMDKNEVGNSSPKYAMASELTKTNEPNKSLNAGSETSISHSNFGDSEEPSFMEVRQKFAEVIRASTSTRKAPTAGINKSSNNETTNSTSNVISSTVYSSSIVNNAHINDKDPRLRKAVESTNMSRTTTATTQSSFLSNMPQTLQINNNNNNLRGCSSIPVRNYQYQHERPILPLMYETVDLTYDDVAYCQPNVANHSFGYNHQDQFFVRQPQVQPHLQQFNGINNQSVNFQHRCRPPPRRSSLYNEKPKVNLQQQRPSSSKSRPATSTMTNNKNGSSFGKDKLKDTLTNGKEEPININVPTAVEPSHLDKLYRGNDVKLNFPNKKIAFKIPKKGGGSLDTKTSPDVMNTTENSPQNEDNIVQASTSSIAAKKTNSKDKKSLKKIDHVGDKKESKSKKENVQQKFNTKEKIENNKVASVSGVSGDVASTSDKENTMEETNTMKIINDFASASAAASTGHQRVMKRRRTMIEYDSAPLCTLKELSKKSKVYEDVYVSKNKKSSSRTLARLFETTDDNCSVSTQNIITGSRRSHIGSVTVKKHTKSLKQKNATLKKSQPEKRITKSKNVAIKKVKSKTMKPLIRKCVVKLKRLPLESLRSFNYPSPLRKILKNTRKIWHSLSTLINYCIICDIQLKQDMCVTHYVHKHKEFYAARLHSSILEQLKKNQRNRPHHVTIFQKRLRYFHCCPFCLEGKRLMFFNWMEHIAKHTGEFNYQCSKCLLPRIRNQNLTLHLMECGEDAKIVNNNYYNLDNRAFIECHVCHLCNFVQLCRTNLDKHFIHQHNLIESTVASLGYKVCLIDFLNVPDVSKLHGIGNVNNIELSLMKKYTREALKIVSTSQFDAGNAADVDDNKEDDNHDLMVDIDEVVDDKMVDAVIEDAVVDDEVIDDEVFHDEVFDDEVIDDEVFHDEVFDDEVLDDDVFADEVVAKTTSNKEVDHEKNVNEEVNHENNDNEEVNHENNDNEKVNHENNDNEKVSHENNDNEKVNHENNDNEKVNHENNDNEKVNHENAGDEVIDDNVVADTECDKETTDILNVSDCVEVIENENVNTSFYEQIQQEMLTLAAAQTHEQQPEKVANNRKIIKPTVNLESSLQVIEDEIKFLAAKAAQGNRKHQKILTADDLFANDQSGTNNLEISDIILENSPKHIKRNVNKQPKDNIQSGSKATKTQNKRKMPSANKFNKLRAVSNSTTPQTDKQLVNKTTSGAYSRSFTTEENNNEMELDATTTSTTTDEYDKNIDYEFANVFRPLVTNLDTLLADDCIVVDSIEHDDVDQAANNIAAISTAAADTLENLKVFKSKHNCVEVDFDETKSDTITCMTTTPTQPSTNFKTIPSNCIEYIEVDDDDGTDNYAIAYAMAHTNEPKNNYLCIVGNDDSIDKPKEVVKATSKKVVKKLPTNNPPPLPVVTAKPGPSPSLSLKRNKITACPIKMLPSSCRNNIAKTSTAISKTISKQDLTNNCIVIDHDDDDELDNIATPTIKNDVKALPNNDSLPVPSSSTLVKDNKKSTGLIKVRPLSSLLSPSAALKLNINCDNKRKEEDEEPVLIAESFVAHESNNDFLITQTVSADYQNNTTFSNVGFNISLQPNYSRPSARQPIKLPTHPVRLTKASSIAVSTAVSTAASTASSSAAPTVKLNTINTIHNIRKLPSTTTVSVSDPQNKKHYLKCKASFCQFKTLVLSSMRYHLLFHQNHNFTGKNDYLMCDRCSYVAKDIDDFMNHAITKHQPQMVNENSTESNRPTSTSTISSSTTTTTTSKTNITEKIRNILTTSVIPTAPESLPSPVFTTSIIQMVENLVASTGLPENKIYKCPVKNCHVVASEESYNTHVLFHTKSTGTNNMPCPHCHQVLQNLPELKKHLNQHGRHNIFCFDCLTTARIDVDMQKHISVKHWKHSVEIMHTIIKFDPNQMGQQYYAASARKLTSTELNEFYVRLRQEYQTRFLKNKIFYKPCELGLMPKGPIFEKLLYCEECKFSSRFQTEFVSHIVQHVVQTNKIWEQMKKNIHAGQK